jgi:hypothetical protein
MVFSNRKSHFFNVAYVNRNVWTIWSVNIFHIFPAFRKSLKQFNGPRTRHTIFTLVLVNNRKVYVAESVSFMGKLVPNICLLFQSLSGRAEQHVCAKTLVTATEESGED